MSNMRRAAEKGFLGFDALINPDSVAPAIQPQGALPGAMVAQNDATNELGFADRLKVSIPHEQALQQAGIPSSGIQVRSAEQAARNEQLLQQGYSADQIKSMELQSKMK